MSSKITKGHNWQSRRIVFNVNCTAKSDKYSLKIASNKLNSILYYTELEYENRYQCIDCDYWLLKETFDESLTTLTSSRLAWRRGLSLGFGFITVPFDSAPVSSSNEMKNGPASFSPDSPEGGIFSCCSTRSSFIRPLDTVDPKSRFFRSGRAGGGEGVRQPSLWSTAETFKAMKYFRWTGPSTNYWSSDQVVTPRRFTDPIHHICP